MTAHLQLNDQLRRKHVAESTAAAAAFATSELTRNGLQFAGGCQLLAIWSQQSGEATLEVVVTDRGPGIPGLKGPLSPEQFGGGLTVASQVFPTLQVANRSFSGVQAVARMPIESSQFSDASHPDVRDIANANRKLTQENARLVAMLCDLEDTIRKKCNFVSSMSRAMRTPLHSLVGILDDNHAAVGLPKNLINEARRHGERLLGMFDQLGDFAMASETATAPELRHCHKFDLNRNPPLDGSPEPEPE